MKPIDISRELFDQHFRPRLGVANPEQIANPYWEWEVRRRLHGDDVYPSRVRRELEINVGEEEFAPTWTFSRMGATETVLADGTRVFIAGEYEDWYDPDFYIYNDVIVVSSAGEVSIFGYPREIFPPTDFHSATLVDGKILIVGSVGYAKDRIVGATPVCALSLADFSIRRLPSFAEAPGWIHDHETEFSGEGEICICGGEVLEEVRGEKHFWRNHSTFTYDLAIGQWRCVSLRDCRQWKMMREDHRPWSEDIDFGFENFLTPEELRDSQSDDEALYRHRKLRGRGMETELDFDFNSLEIAIEGAAQEMAEAWIDDLNRRLSAACGAECAIVERGH